MFVVCLQVDFFDYIVGSGDFLFSFFSTVSYQLEPAGWGTKYPFLLNDLYRGRLGWEDVPRAERELEEIQAKFGRFQPVDVIWDIDDLNMMPPLEERHTEAASLADCFICRDGRDLFDALALAMKDSMGLKADITIGKRQFSEDYINNYRFKKKK